MVSKTSAAAPLAPNIEPKWGAAFPIEKEPIITQKNTCKKFKKKIFLLYNLLINFFKVSF